MKLGELTLIISPSLMLVLFTVSLMLGSMAASDKLASNDTPMQNTAAEVVVKLMPAWESLKVGLGGSAVSDFLSAITTVVSCALVVSRETSIFRCMQHERNMESYGTN
jgi:hypothetical protein